MKHLLLSVFFLFSLLAHSSTPQFDHHSLVVKLSQNADLPQSNFYKRAQHLFGSYYVLWTDHLQELENSLQSNKNIQWISRNYKAPKRKLYKYAPMPELDLKSMAESPFNDPQIGRQWTFRDSEQYGISINKSYTNRIYPAKEDVIVAVVDTGVDYTHEDLKDVMWNNPNEIPSNGIDDDNDGYIDDVYGINTLIRDSRGHATGNPRPLGEGHGTHVAGIIGAKQNNNLGMAGIASRVKIMAIRTVPDNGDETDVDVAESYLYAAQHGARIINCSFGKEHNEGGQLVADTIKHIGETYGTLVVAAAGNDGQLLENRPMYPAIFPNEHLLVVASTNSNGSMSYFSNYSTKSVDVAAPGAGILSTLPRNSYGSLSGTSMASPTVVGVAAEVLSSFPQLAPLQLKQILIDSATSVSSFHSRVLSGGRVDLESALELASKTPSP